jgi:hypothetical protein
MTPQQEAFKSTLGAYLSTEGKLNGLIIIPPFSTLIKNYVGISHDNYAIGVMPTV